MSKNTSKIDINSVLQMKLNKAISKSLSVGDIVEFIPPSEEAGFGVTATTEIKPNERLKISSIESGNSWPSVGMIRKNGITLNTRMVECFTKVNIKNET